MFYQSPTLVQQLQHNLVNNDQHHKLSEQLQSMMSQDETESVSAVAPFKSKFLPTEMRQLALVAHNHMKPAMEEFIKMNSEVLQKFRITGTETTMKMCKALWGENDPDIHYGLTCTSGPLGGDAQIASLISMEDLGALFFFVDPLSAHPHQADIESLIRLCNVGNIIVCPNPMSAMCMMHIIKQALEIGSRDMIPSFFQTFESPSVEEYKRQQAIVLRSGFRGLDRSISIGPRTVSGILEDRSIHSSETLDRSFSRVMSVENIGTLDCSIRSQTKSEDAQVKLPATLNDGSNVAQIIVRRRGLNGNNPSGSRGRDVGRGIADFEWQIQQKVDSEKDLNIVKAPEDMPPKTPKRTFSSNSLKDKILRSKAMLRKSFNDCRRKSEGDFTSSFSSSCSAPLVQRLDKEESVGLEYEMGFGYEIDLEEEA